MSDRKRSALPYGCEVSFRARDAEGYIASPGGADPRLFIREGTQVKDLLAFESSVFQLCKPLDADELHQAGSLAEITYGARICIKHKQSNLYLALLSSQPSIIDANCHTLTLVTAAEVTSSSFFKLVPRFKIHTEGDYICQEDQLHVQLVEKSLFFHISETEAFTALESEFTLRSGISEGENVVEVNGSEDPGTFTIRRYDPGTEDAAFIRESKKLGKSAVFAGSPVAVFHREREALLMSSTSRRRSLSVKRPASNGMSTGANIGVTPRQRRGSSTSKGAVHADLTDSLTKSSEGDGTTATGTSSMLPYPAFFESDMRASDDNSFQDLKCSCSALWIFEGKDPTIGGPLRFGVLYRVRQAATNMYLSVAPSKDAEAEEETADNLVLVENPRDPRVLRNCLFRITPFFSTDAMYVTETDFFRLQSAEHNLWLVSDSELNTAIPTFRLLLSPTQTHHDALLMGHVAGDMQRNVLSLFHDGQFLRIYIELFQNLAAAEVDHTPRKDSNCEECPSALHTEFRSSSFSLQIKCVTDALASLIRFCSLSDDENPLTREGLPIQEHQRMLFDLNFHRLVFDVLVAPFVGTRMTHLPTIPLRGGVINIDDILNPEYSQIHYICRLCFRLLKQMVRGTSTFASTLAEYIPFMYFVDGLKLHVADTMMEIFTDNDRLSRQTYCSAADHYINLLKMKSKSAGYLTFLAIICHVGEAPIVENQIMVSEKMLGYASTSMLLPTVLMESGDLGVVWKKNEAPIAYEQFLKNHSDVKQVKYFTSQVHFLAMLTLGSNPELVSVVSDIFPTPQAMSVIGSIEKTMRETSTRETPVIAEKLDATRGNLVRLIVNLYAVPVLRNPEHLMKSNTVLLGGSELRVSDKDTSYSGVEDNQFIAALKKMSSAVLGRCPYQEMDRNHRNEFICTVVNTWHIFFEHWQYSRSEAEGVVGQLIPLLDGSNDVFTTKKLLSLCSAERWNRYERTEANLTAMKTKEAICRTLGTLLHNEVRRAANSLLQIIYDTFEGLSDGSFSSMSGSFNRSPTKETSSSSSSSCANVVREVAAELHRLAQEVSALFQPQVLVSILMDCVRYDSDELTSCALDLLVRLCGVKREISELTMSVDLCPTVDDVLAFDRMYLVAVELHVAAKEGDREEIDDAVEIALKSMLNTDLLQVDHTNASSQGNTDVASSTGALVSPQMSEYIEHESEDAGLGDPDDPRALSPWSPSGTLDKPVVTRTASGTAHQQWSNARAVMKVLAFSKAVQRKRNMIGGMEMEVSPDVLRRADMMRHWGIHTTILAILRDMTLDNPTYPSVMEFFYYFCMSPANAKVLAPHVSLFLQGIPHPTAHSHCMHVVIRIMGSVDASSEAVDRKLMSRLVEAIAKEKSERAPDASFVKLVNKSIASSHMHPVSQRKLLTLLQNNGVFSSLGEVSPKWSSAQLVFNSALVMLLRNLCASNPSTKHSIQRVLQSSTLISVLLKSGKENGEIPRNHQTPYLRLLSVAHFALDESESRQERLRHKSVWMQTSC